MGRSILSLFRPWVLASPVLFVILSVIAIGPAQGQDSLLKPDDVDDLRPEHFPAAVAGTPIESSLKSCSRQEIADLDLTMKPLGDGEEPAPAYSHWTTTALYEKSILAIHELGAQSDAFVGVYASHRDQVLVVVVEPGSEQSPLPAILAEDERLVESRIVVRPSCFSRDERQQASQRLLAALNDKANSRAISRDGIGIATDIQSGRILVVLSDKAAEELKSVLDSPIFLIQRSGERGPSRMGRHDDTSPHRGGSGIADGTYTGANNDCSSGPSATRNGTNVSTTAAHCAFAGLIYSGQEYFGWWNTPPSYPDTDATVISSNVVLYGKKMWADPCCPNTRTFNHRRDAVVGDSHCSSGATTTARCGWNVVGNDLDPNSSCIFVDEDGTTTGLFCSEITAFSSQVNSGDSGGPIYKRRKNNRAKILGLIVAGGDPVLGSNTFNFMWSQQPSRIESVLGVVLP